MLKKDGAQVGLFFLLAFIISWTLFALGYEGIDHVLGYVAKFGFTISALMVMVLAKDWERLKEIGRKFIERDQLKYLWLGLMPMLFYIIAALLSADINTFKVRYDFRFIDFIYVVLLSPNSGVIFYMLLRGGLGEEIGLRAYAIPKLRKVLSPLKVGLVIGVFWATWHYIVWWDQGVLNLTILTIAVLAWSMIYTYIYLRTGSLWTVILLHAMGNAFDDIMEWVYPNLTQIDWEIPYILCVLLWGLICMVLLRRMYRKPYTSN